MSVSFPLGRRSNYIMERRRRDTADFHVRGARGRFTAFAYILGTRTHARTIRLWMTSRLGSNNSGWSRDGGRSSSIYICIYIERYKRAMQLNVRVENYWMNGLLWFCVAKVAGTRIGERLSVRSSRESTNAGAFGGKLMEIGLRSVGLCGGKALLIKTMRLFSI